MKLPQRLWIWVFLGLLALVVLGMVLQAIQQLQWTLSTWLPYWMVGPLMLIMLAALVVALAQVGWPWLRRLRQGGTMGPGKSAPAAVPSSRREAAQRNLGSIDRTLAQVRDAVEREALRQERQRMEAELERGDLVIVVFGTGSTGKTSLIRALLQELVGEVGAPMGSTTAATRYRLRLKDLPRAVILEDTPGILEAGREGRERERVARELAARADLLLLVLDGDLRASELEVFEALAGLGKRLLLVLNKCDLRGEEEERRLLALLRQRCAARLGPEDVIPASAAPRACQCRGASRCSRRRRWRPCCAASPPSCMPTGRS